MSFRHAASCRETRQVWGKRPRRWRQALIGLLFLPLACSPVTWVADQLERSPDLPGKIAFLTPSGDVNTIDPDGGSLRAITDDAGHVEGETSIIRRYDQPTWARASRKLAFVQVDRESDGTGSAYVLIADGDTGTSEVVFHEPGVSPFYFYWALSSEELTFLASRPLDPLLALYLVDEAGETHLVDRGQPYYWAWSPQDSSMMQRVGGAGDRSRISLRASPFEDEQDLPYRPAQFQAPAWSNTGERVVVAADVPSGHTGLIVLDENGELLEELVPTSHPVAFDWSADGEYLAYLEQTGPQQGEFGELMLIEMDNSGPDRIRPSGVDSAAAFFWSPSGQDLIAIVPVFTAPGTDQQIAWRTQELELRLRYVLVDVDRDELRTIVEFRPTGQFLQLLPFFDQYQRSATIWSPDGKAIVYSAQREDGAPEVFVQEVAPDSNAKVLAEGTVAIWSFK